MMPSRHLGSEAQISSTAHGPDAEDDEKRKGENADAEDGTHEGKHGGADEGHEAQILNDLEAGHDESDTCHYLGLEVELPAATKSKSRK